MYNFEAQFITQCDAAEVLSIKTRVLNRNTIFMLKHELKKSVGSCKINICKTIL
jgi:hypothetical protein